MIKVLFAINNLNIGGAERLVLGQLRVLNNEGVDGYLLTTLPDPEKNFAPNAAFLGDKLIKFRFRGLWDVFSLIRLVFFLKKEKFDAIITNLFFTNCVVRAAAILAAVPVILSYEHNVYTDKRRWQIAVDRALSRYTDRIIAVSRAVLDFTSKQEKISPEKFTLIYNGIFLNEALSPSRDEKQLKELLTIPAETPIISSAGRLVEQKGHIYLIQAANSIRKLRPDLRFRILIFGSGELKERLAAEIAGLSLGDFVQMPGVWPMADILEISDIFALPSLREGLPMALLEAFAAGKPAIAAAVGGSPELIKDGLNGFLVEPKDADSLAKKIILLLSDSQLRLRLGAIAKETASDFSIENNTDKIKQLIASLLEIKKHE